MNLGQLGTRGTLPDAQRIKYYSAEYGITQKPSE
jgi:hypothetical protein